MNQKLFKKTVKWLLFVIIEHFVSAFLFGVIFRNIVSQLQIGGQYELALLILFAYGLFADILLIYLCTSSEISYTEYRKNLKDIIEAGEFSIFNQLRSWVFEESLYKAVAYTLFQIPFAISYRLLGFLTKYAPEVSDFYGLDSFYYLITDSALWGWILRGVSFGVINAVVTIVLLLITKDELDDYVVRDDERIESEERQ